MLKKQDFCFGRQPVLEALESGQSMERIFLRKGISGVVIDRIETEARKQALPINRVPKEKLNRITNLNHQGVVAILSPVHYYRVEDIVDQCFADGKDPLLIILDGVTDVGNFGAICRTALGLGVDALVIGQFRSAPVNAQAVKSSAGAIHHLKICRHKELTGIVDYLKNMGIRLVAMDGSGDTYFRETDLEGPLALIMGSEGEGIHQDLLNRADIIARLPIDERLESYNVSVAAAMALYEIKRVKD